MRKDGSFVDEQGNILQGSDKITALLGRCQLYTGVVLERLVTLVRSSLADANQSR